jgi:Na+(H+)/acetate symporter ActP
LVLVFLAAVTGTLMVVAARVRARRVAAPLDRDASGRPFTGPSPDPRGVGDVVATALFLGVVAVAAVGLHDGKPAAIGFAVAWLAAVVGAAGLLRVTGRLPMIGVVGPWAARPGAGLAASAVLLAGACWLALVSRPGAVLPMWAVPAPVPEVAIGTATVLAFAVAGRWPATRWAPMLRSAGGAAGVFATTTLLVQTYQDQVAVLLGWPVLSWPVQSWRTLDLDGLAVLLSRGGSNNFSFVLLDGDALVTPDIHLVGPRWPLSTAGPSGRTAVIVLGLVVLLVAAGVPRLLGRFWSPAAGRTGRWAPIWAGVLVGAFYLYLVLIALRAMSALQLPARVPGTLPPAIQAVSAVALAFLVTVGFAIALTLAVATLAGPAGDHARRRAA